VSRVRAFASWFAFASLASIASAASLFERGRGDPAAGAPDASPNVASIDARRAPAPKPSVPHTFSISGRVVDAYGDPITEAEVLVEDMSGNDARSVWLGADGDGRFAAPRVSPGLHTVTVSARGFVARAVALDIDADVAELRLELAAAPAPRVLVVDPQGRAVADAVVVACTDGAEVTLRSAADGTVTFGRGAIGCAATAHHGRFAHSEPVKLGGQRLHVARLERGGSVEGVVTDSHGHGMFDGEVTLNSFDPAEGEAPLSGSLPELTLTLGREFRLSGLAPGVYGVAVLRRIRRSGCESVGQLATTSLEVAAGRVARGVHIVVEPSDVSAEIECDST
jgi:hypothetical protein